MIREMRFAVLTSASVFSATLLIAIFSTCPADLGAAESRSQYPVRIGPNGRYLVDQKGQPYLIQGDSPWSLIVGTTNQEAERYLADRRSKGFNTLVVNLIEHKFCKDAPKNKVGEGPFTVSGDFSTPNEKYFTHADWLIRKAAENGMQVLLFPLYLGVKGADEGFFQEALANGPAKCRRYGQYVGKRYRDFDNIIWVMGGDRDPEEALEDVNALALGIREVDQRHLITAHCSSEHSAVEDYAQEGWLDLNSTYTYRLVHPKLLEDYGRKPVWPYFLLETTYEGEHNAPPVQIRRQAYWADLSGATGQVMGSCPVWGFDYFANWEKGDDTIFNGDLYRLRSIDHFSDQQNGLDSTASRDMARLHKLFTSRAWYELVPDQMHSVVTTGLGELNGLDYLAAARAEDGSTVIAYMPTARKITVDMSKTSGTEANAWWFNPRSGEASAAGNFPTQGFREFTPPGTGDWVLVLDDSSREFGPPGSPNP
jgi:Protein of unknown function (DUF4038)/Putative collagen-binding domain of a collagenase